MDRIIIWVIIYIAWRVLKGFLSNIKNSAGLSDAGKVTRIEQYQAYNVVNNQRYDTKNSQAFEETIEPEQAYSYEQKEPKYKNQEDDIEGDYYNKDLQNTLFHQNNDKGIESHKSYGEVGDDEKQVAFRNENLKEDVFVWSDQTLVNSIIMSEVLGSPKVRKRFRN